MSYIPDPNANIGKIFKCLNGEFFPLAEIRDRVKQEFPEVPLSSISTHLRFLKEKELVSIEEQDGVRYYALKNGKTKLPEIVQKQESSKPYIILQYCKKHIGERINASKLKDIFNWRDTDTTPGTVLGRLNDQGGVQLIPGTKPFDYQILPAITDIEKVDWSNRKKQELIPKHQIQVNEKDISQMNIGEIINDYATIKAENQRLKSALQRMAIELMDIIEIEK